ncbi:TIGR03792 family protein [Prochlorococcus marinus]|uniref:TIGR03792 family protein n=1 Tax=Prochlorococcus marinus TaxID=1219 RepID=UPI0022B5E3F3|nr:TIGR03792 family protein [Prochlorococcus marinus]
MINSNTSIVEYLKLSVSRQDKEAWLSAEKRTWEPWLEKQKGFLDRQLFWDPLNEEAIVLIRWASREEWKAIPQVEIDHVQELFEKIAKDSTGEQSLNPFPIKFQGELSAL